MDLLAISDLLSLPSSAMATQSGGALGLPEMRRNPYPEMTNGEVLRLLTEAVCTIVDIMGDVDTATANRITFTSVNDGGVTLREAVDLLQKELADWYREAEAEGR